MIEAFEWEQDVVKIVSEVIWRFVPAPDV